MLTRNEVLENTRKWLREQESKPIVLANLLSEYQQAHKNLLLHGTDDERQKVHLFTGSDVTLSFILGMLAVTPIVMVGFALISSGLL